MNIAPKITYHKEETVIRNVADVPLAEAAKQGVVMCSVHPGLWVCRPGSLWGRILRDCPVCVAGHSRDMVQTTTSQPQPNPATAAAPLTNSSPASHYSTASSSATIVTSNVGSSSSSSSSNRSSKSDTKIVGTECIPTTDEGKVVYYTKIADNFK